VSVPRKARTNLSKDGPKKETMGGDLLSLLTAKLGKNALLRMEYFTHEILEDLILETVQILTDLEDGKSSRNPEQALLRHHIADHVQQITNELNVMEKQERQIITNTHNELIQIRQPPPSIQLSAMQADTPSDTPSSTAPLLSTSGIFQHVKEYKRHLKEVRGDVDTTNMVTSVAEDILSDLLSTTTNDMLSVCDGYIDRLVRAEFTV